MSDKGGFRPLSSFSSPLHFSTCGNCRTCCDGSHFQFAPLVLDDFISVYRYFPIVIIRIENIWRPVMILGDNGCRYLIENECTLYTDRPPVCRSYPISPYFHEIYIDTSCTAVGEKGEVLWDEKGKISSQFTTERLENFVERYTKTVQYFQKNSMSLNLLKMWNGIFLFTLSTHDNYSQMIKESQKNLGKII